MSELPAHHFPRGPFSWAAILLALMVAVPAHARQKSVRRAPAKTAKAAGTPKSAPEAPAETPDRTAARDMAKEALELMHQSRWPEAQSLLSRAYALVKAPTIALLEGQSLEQMGKLVEARGRYEKAKDVGPGTPPDAFVEAAKEATRRAAFLDRRIPKVTIILERDPLDPHVPTVTLDGSRLAESEWSLPMSVNPGEHVVGASVEGGVAVEDHILVKETETKEVRLRLRRPVPVRRYDPPIAQPSPERGPSTTTLGLVSLGAGVVGLGVGVASGIVMLNAKSSLDAQCGGGCPPEAEDELSRFRTARVASYVGYGVGILGVSVGSALLLFGPREKPVEPIGTLRIGLGPGTATLRGSF